jgi:hypothetical protein
MPASAPTATRAVDTPLWDPATGARQLLIADPDPGARNAALAALYTAVADAPDVCVWADPTAHKAVAIPRQLRLTYHAIGDNARMMLRLANELDVARRASIAHDGRWLYRPALNGRMIVVVVDLTTLANHHVPAAVAALHALTATGHRTAMSAVTLVDPGAIDNELLAPLRLACTAWRPPAIAADLADRPLSEVAA